jgi:alkanesulfonate monooxygenase SsuD/methylene tetrahydromethanopterin reductase-like flavin-dependent oxidoreductase (luciferase family)
MLVGGNSNTAIRRAAAYGDGWYPSQIAPHTLARGVTKLRQLAADPGRLEPAIHVGGLTIQTSKESARVAREAREAFVRRGREQHQRLPGTPSAGTEWMRQCELVAEAHTMGS